jgi:hypothetical protein
VGCLAEVTSAASPLLHLCPNATIAGWLCLRATGTSQGLGPPGPALASTKRRQGGATAAPSCCLGRGRLLCLRLLDDQPDLAFQQRPLMPIDRAPDAVVWLPPHQWQQADDNVGTGRYERIRPTGRGYHRLPQLKAMIRHVTYVGSDRNRDNRPSSERSASFAG